MKSLLLLAALILLVAAAPPVATGPVRLCPGLDPAADCRPVDLTTVGLAAPETLLVRTVRVEPRALPLARPSMVWVIALASSEVRWNGIVIGRNGMPGPTRAEERPGRFVATFVVPPRLMRPGDNLLSVRLSAHRLFLPVRTPVHMIEIAPYETPALPGLGDYLPALLTLGALAAACLYFLAAGLRLPAAVAALTVTQLIVEVSRAFVAYTYPWHLARVSAVALLAAIAAVLIADYAAARFAPDWRRRIRGVTAAAALASLVLFPWYDLKALGAILAGALALGICAARGLKARRPGAAVGLVGAMSIVAAMVWQLSAFLDQAYYLILAALLAVLVLEQVAALRRARAERDTERKRASALAERLARAEREGEPIVAIRDGGRIHRVAESDIVAIRAADDYCDVTLRDGRNLLTTLSLSRFLATLPARFVRVHKSHAVNRAHVTTIAPKPGGGKLLRLSDGSEIPVGRSYEAAVAAAITRSPAIS